MCALKKRTYLSNKRDILHQDTLQIRFGDTLVTDCSSAIIVPERAVHEAGYIKTLTTNAHAHSKHEFQAMAQTVYYRFQDDELEIVQGNGALILEWQGETETIEGGIVIYRDESGEFHVLAHSGQQVKKLLEAAYRFCTRWVRLDI
jgi:lipopolysaccharide export system protein LptA